MVARPLNVRPGFSEVYDKHEVEGLADWVGGCRGGILGVEGDTPYLIRQQPVFLYCVLPPIPRWEAPGLYCAYLVWAK